MENQRYIDPCARILLMPSKSKRRVTLILSVHFPPFICGVPGFDGRTRLSPVAVRYAWMSFRPRRCPIVGLGLGWVTARNFVRVIRAVSPLAVKWGNYSAAAVKWDNYSAAGGGGQEGVKGIATCQAGSSMHAWPGKLRTPRFDGCPFRLAALSAATGAFDWAGAVGGGSRDGAAEAQSGAAGRDR